MRYKPQKTGRDPGPLIAYEYRPGSIYLNITNRCTNACCFCSLRINHGQLGPFDLNLSGQLHVPLKVHPARLDGVDYEEPSVETIKAAVEPCLKKDGKRIKEVVFCGCGEPLIRLDEVLEVSRFLKDRGFRVRVNTNGQAGLMHGPAAAKRLSRYVDEVSISLNAQDAQNYLLLCRPAAGEAAYESLLAFAQECALAVERTVLSIVRLPSDEMGRLNIDLDEKACNEIAEGLGLPLRIR